MNTFALLLFSWALYLAVNGRLVAYFDLAKAGASTPPAKGG